MMSLVLLLHVLFGTGLLGSALLSFVNKLSAKLFVPALLGTTVTGAALLITTPTLGAACVRLVALTGIAVLVRLTAAKYASN